MLLEFFKRNAEDFEWDNETLDKKIQNLSNNVNSFEYVGKDVLNSAAGRFNDSKRNIELLKNPRFSSSYEVATTLMHELKHAVDNTERGYTKVEHSFDTRINIKGIEINGLDELITEGATIKTKGKNPYTDKYATTYKYDSGYKYFYGILSMLSSALGMSESEFLKLAEKGEDKCKDTLEAKYPGLNFGRKLDEMQDSLTYLSHVFESNGHAAMAYSQLYNTINYIYENRINVDRQSPDFDSIRARYDEYKINKNLLKATTVMGLSKKVLASEIPDYKQVKLKAKIQPEEKQAFKEIGSEIIGEIKIRDNSTLVKSGRDIKKASSVSRLGVFMKKIFSKLNTQKLIPERSNESNLVVSQLKMGQQMDKRHLWNLTEKQMQEFRNGESEIIANHNQQIQEAQNKYQQGINNVSKVQQNKYKQDMSKQDGVQSNKEQASEGYSNEEH